VFTRINTNWKSWHLSTSNCLATLSNQPGTSVCLIYTHLQYQIWTPWHCLLTKTK
jgi:hypothetical protein